MNIRIINGGRRSVVENRSDAPASKYSSLEATPSLLPDSALARTVAAVADAHRRVLTTTQRLPLVLPPTSTREKVPLPRFGRTG